MLVAMDRYSLVLYRRPGAGPTAPHLPHNLILCRQVRWYLESGQFDQPNRFIICIMLVSPQTFSFLFSLLVPINQF